MRIPALLVGAPLLLGALHAQCLDTSGGSPAGLVATGTDPVDDEGRSAPIALGFSFPMAGSLAGNYTHAVVESNGVIYLTTGGAATGTVNFGPTGLGSLRGVAGASPRVFPLWTDLWASTINWAVNVDASVPGRFKVTWIDVEEFLSFGDRFSMSASLFASGAVEFSYDGLPPLPNFNAFAAAGVSIGDQVGTATTPSSNLVAGADSGTVGLLFETLIGVVPAFSDRSVLLSPNGTGGYASALSCQTGTHENNGGGCYGDSFYQLLPDAAAASAALQGNALFLTPNSNGYTAAWLPGASATLFKTPVAATDFARSDDGQVAFDLSAAGLPPFPFPGGSTTMLWVHSNGFVSTTGATNDNGAWNTEFGTDFEPSPSLVKAPETAFWAWHDWNPADTAGGPVRWHYEAATTTLCITWDGVENYSVPTVANPGRFQFQFDLTSGAVRYVWDTVDANTTSDFGSAHAIGYSPAGASSDPGSMFLAQPGGNAITINGFSAIRLDAAPEPVILGSGSSNPITYTVANIPDAAPPAQVRFGFLTFSVAPLPGVDLGFLGAPACALNIASLDVIFPFSSVGSDTVGVPLVYPPPLAPGLAFWSQAIAFFPANSFPGGLNSFGITTSNGLRTQF